MKTKTFLLLLVSSLMLAVGLTSCEDDVYREPTYNGLVTVRYTESEVLYFQLDDVRTLYPVNMGKGKLWEEGQRALINFYVVDEDDMGFTDAVYVNWIERVLTKSMVESKGAENDLLYGRDPVEIVRDWVTVVEDGYLTLRFRTYWSGGVTHTVNLLSGVNPENPYEVEFRHNANGDLNYYVGDGLVAFDLSKLPDTEGKTVKLVLKWMSFSGPKSVVFDYCTSKASNGRLSVEDLRIVDRLVE